MRIFAVAVTVVGLIVSMDAEARLFRGGLFGGRLFGRSRPALRFRNSFVPRMGGCGRAFCQNPNEALRNQNNFANRFIDFRDNEILPGFPNLQKNGKEIIESTLTPEGIPRFRQLTILGDGRLAGAADPVETSRQLKEFYLKNLDGFGITLDDVCFTGGFVGGRGSSRTQYSRRISREADLVARFLKANGGCDALNDTIVVDLSTHGLEERDEYKNADLGPPTRCGRATEIGRRVLNMILNSVSASSEILKIDQNSVRNDCTVTLPNLSRFLRSDAIQLAFGDNPFTKCGQPIPLQWLAERLMNDEIYVRLLGIPQKLKDFGERVGVFTDKTQTQGNKILVYTPPGSATNESVPGVARERILERQPQRGDLSQRFDNVRLGRPGGYFYTSWDFIGDPDPGLGEEARSVFGQFGIRATHDAAEMLWQMPNGFMAGALYNAAGLRQKNAPNNIARGGSLGGTISPMAACLQCHVDGINGGGKILGRDQFYTDVFNDPQNRHPDVPAFSRRFFAAGGNPEYRRTADEDSTTFVNAQRAAEARIEDRNRKGLPAVTDIIAKRRLPLDADAQARELRLPKGSLAGRGAVSRAQFDQAFCSLKGSRSSTSSRDTQRLFLDETASRGQAHDPSRRR